MKKLLVHVVATLSGAAVGLVGWIGGFAVLALLSEHFDEEIDSATIIFHGWGAAAMVWLFSGWMIVPAAAVLANAGPAAVNIARRTVGSGSCRRDAAEPRNHL